MLCAQRSTGAQRPGGLQEARRLAALIRQCWFRPASGSRQLRKPGRGDRNKLKPAADQFSLVCDSLRKLHRNSESLAQAPAHWIRRPVRERPSPALAMEVATAVLYLQAALEETDTAEEQMVALCPASGGSP